MIKVTKRVRLKQETQTWVEMSTLQKGMVLLNSYTPLYTNAMCLAVTGVANLQPDQHFQILIANFGDKLIGLLPHQVVVTASHRFEKLVKSHSSHAEVFSPILNNRDAKFLKRHTNVRDIDKIIKQLACDLEQHSGKD